MAWVGHMNQITKVTLPKPFLQFNLLLHTSGQVAERRFRDFSLAGYRNQRIPTVQKVAKHVLPSLTCCCALPFSLLKEGCRTFLLLTRNTNLVILRALAVRRKQIVAGEESK